MAFGGFAALAAWDRSQKRHSEEAKQAEADRKFQMDLKRMQIAIEEHAVQNELKNAYLAIAEQAAARAEEKFGYDRQKWPIELQKAQMGLAKMANAAGGGSGSGGGHGHGGGGASTGASSSSQVDESGNPLETIAAVNDYRSRLQAQHVPGQPITVMPNEHEQYLQNADEVESIARAPKTILEKRFEATGQYPRGKRGGKNSNLSGDVSTAHKGSIESQKGWLGSSSSGKGRAQTGLSMDGARTLLTLLEAGGEINTKHGAKVADDWFNKRFKTDLSIPDQEYLIRRKLNKQLTGTGQY